MLLPAPHESPGLTSCPVFSKLLGM